MRFLCTFTHSIQIQHFSYIIKFVASTYKIYFIFCLTRKKSQFFFSHYVLITVFNCLHKNSASTSVYYNVIIKLFQTSRLFNSCNAAKHKIIIIIKKEDTFFSDEYLYINIFCHHSNLR